MQSVTERFLRYVQVNTTPDPESESSPSTPRQFDLLRMLKDELTALGASEVVLDDFGYVYAKIPATLPNLPTLGFLAHVDTSPDAPGEGVKPRIVEKYDGGAILLNAEGNVVMSPAEFPELLDYVGQDLIVTDGTTLLGADDKAGVAQIMTLCERLLAPDAPPHCEIAIAFTPDEEIGRGTRHFDVARFGADFAYTIDGGKLGEIEYENFNAASAKVTVNGVSIHPGTSKNKMKNAVLVGMEFHSMLPPAESPAHTEGYEGFYHITDIKGEVERCTLSYIIRDHDKALFEARKERLRAIEGYLNEKYGAGTVAVDIKDSYYNMKEKVLPHMHLIENATAAMRECGVEPIIQPIRGGTDGANLSFMGVPCPNLSTGGHNYHGRFEYIPVQSLTKMVDVMLRVVEKYSAAK
ncbi:MAG: peptidase T [Christensenellales bacterium]|jgi:tripeptide aminopeptidase